MAKWGTRDVASCQFDSGRRTPRACRSFSTPNSGVALTEELDDTTTIGDLVAQTELAEATAWAQDADEPLDKGALASTIGDKGHVHITRCRRITVTVNYAGKHVERKVGPGATHPSRAPVGHRTQRLRPGREQRPKHAPTVEAAVEAMDTFELEWGDRYAGIVKVWRAAWEQFTPFLRLPPEIRKVVYTTNLVESINYQLRKITKTRGHFPSYEAALKLLRLGARNISDKRGGDLGTGTWDGNGRSRPSKSTSPTDSASPDMTTGPPAHTNFLTCPGEAILAEPELLAAGAHPLTERSGCVGSWSLRGRSHDAAKHTVLMTIRPETFRPMTIRIVSNLCRSQSSGRCVQSRSHRPLLGARPACGARTRLGFHGELDDLSPARSRTPTTVNSLRPPQPEKVTDRVSREPRPIHTWTLPSRPRTVGTIRPALHGHDAFIPSKNASVSAE